MKKNLYFLNFVLHFIDVIFSPKNMEGNLLYILDHNILIVLENIPRPKHLF